MNKYILTLAAALSLAPALCAGDAAQDLIKFKELASKQKGEWLQRWGDMFVDKAKILQDEKAKWTAFDVKNIKELSAAGSVSPEWWNKVLEGALVIYKETCQAEKDLRANLMKNAHELIEKQKEELKAFEESRSNFVKQEESPKGESSEKGE